MANGLAQLLCDSCRISLSMGIKSLFTGIFILLSTYLLIINQCENALAAPGNNANTLVEAHRPPRTRPFTRFGPRPAGGQYARIKPEIFNEFLDDDDLFELSKRQASDDYGHLRFGKRGEELFDDYGHMRFGRSGGSSDK